MDWHQIYSEAKSWQAAIGALLGFCALIAGALFNYRLNRRRDARLRHEEAVSIAAALFGEIVHLRGSAARVARGVAQRYHDHGLGKYGKEPFDKHFLEMLAIPPSHLYSSLAPKIGLLPSNLTLQIVAFYSAIDEVRFWLPQLEEDEARSFGYSVLTVLRPALDAVNNISPALRQIEAMAKIRARAEDPDVGDAPNAAEAEKEMFESARTQE
jgi:hypothetical protein